MHALPKPMGRAGGPIRLGGRRDPPEPTVHATAIERRQFEYPSLRIQFVYDREKVLACEWHKREQIRLVQNHGIG